MTGVARIEIGPSTGVPPHLVYFGVVAVETPVLAQCGHVCVNINRCCRCATKMGSPLGFFERFFEPCVVCPT